MKIQTLALTSIKPYWRNPRKNDAAVAGVAASIREFGMNQPLVLDEEGVIIAGHTRYRALLDLGEATAPCIVVKLDPARARAYRIADNKTGEAADWDADKLMAELREIGDEVDMTEFFTEGDLDAILKGLDLSTATQKEIDDASDKASAQFDNVAASASSEQVEVTCPHCGEKSFIQKEHLLREMLPKDDK